MTRHWKTMLWFAALVLAGSIGAFATQQYFVFYGIVLITLVAWFVLGVSWSDESKSKRQGPRPAR